MDLAAITRHNLPQGHCRGAVNNRCHARIELGDTWQPSIWQSEDFEVPVAKSGADLDGNPESDCNYQPCKQVAAWIQFQTMRRVRRGDPVDLGLLRLNRQHREPQPFQFKVPAGVSELTLVCRHLPPNDYDGAHHAGGSHGDTHFDAYYDLYDRPVKRCPVRPCGLPVKGSSTKTCPSTKASMD
jgi:hypothetical protein